mgnify:CR=1 FL=1
MRSRSFGLFTIAGVYGAHLCPGKKRLRSAQEIVDPGLELSPARVFRIHRDLAELQRRRIARTALEVAARGLQGTGEGVDHIVAAGCELEQ